MAVANFQKPRLWLGIETLGRRAFLLLVGGVVVAAVLYWHVFETRYYRAAIPAEIGLTFDFATTGSDVSVWGAVFRFDRKACGGAIFKLTDAAATVISERGLNFLKDARQGRDYTDKMDRSFHSYMPWQMTPLPSEWTSNGTWLGLSCMGLRNSVIRSILDAAQKTGSFYSTGQDKMLLVVPSLQMAILTYTR